ncbi:MAG: cell division protein FtsQ/DivIB [Parvularculaceae bacterium]
MPAVKRKAKKKLSPFQRVAAVFENYTIAGIAGSAVIVSLLLVVLWAGGYVGMLARAADRAAGSATASAGFEVRRVLLRGAHQITQEEILAALGTVVGEPMVQVSLREARNRIESLGWVRAAAVTRLMPDTLVVAIREREPAAVWQVNGDLRLIDDSGAVIRAVGAYEYSNLPLIVGSGAPDAAAALLQALGAHSELQTRTYALIRVSDRRWNLRLRNNITIKLPETDIAKAVGDLALLHAAQSTLDQPLEYIDLRDPERMIIRRRDGTGDADAAGTEAGQSDGGKLAAG